MYHWCCACLWQTLVISCTNAYPHVNKPEFEPLTKSCLFAETLAVRVPCETHFAKTVAQCMNRYHKTIVTLWIN